MSSPMPRAPSLYNSCAEASIARDAASSFGGGHDVDALLLDALVSGCWDAYPASGSRSLATCNPGDVLARRYEIERELGRGGMGEVYSALDRVRERRVAIKTVSLTLADDPGAVQRLQREARHARSVRHPHVICVHELGVHADDPRDIIHFLVMDLIAGPSLKSWRRATLPPLSAVLELARQLLEGLAAVHAAGLVHGDVKPDNVMLVGGEPLHAVLIDFGLAQRMAVNQQTRRACKSGSLGYMAPEQMQGATLSPRTDIFAFGVVLFELLVGALPFERSASGRGVREQDWTPTAPSVLRPGVPRQLEELVLRCLSHAPEERFASAEQLREALSVISAPSPEWG